MRFTVHLAELPVHSLNKLESLALDIFSRDLTISPVVWISGWDMLLYHLSLSPPSYSQLIFRPSSNPQSLLINDSASQRPQVPPRFHASDAIDTYARASEPDPSNHIPTAYTRLVASAVVRPPGLTGPPLLLQSALICLPFLRGTGLRVQYPWVYSCSSLNVPAFVSIIFFSLFFFNR